MGMGTGTNCERCGNQIYYDDSDYELKSDGMARDLCVGCLKDFKKAEWDKNNK